MLKPIRFRMRKMERLSWTNSNAAEVQLPILKEIVLKSSFKNWCQLKLQYFGYVDGKNWPHWKKTLKPRKIWSAERRDTENLDTWWFHRLNVIQLTNREMVKDRKACMLCPWAEKESDMDWVRLNGTDWPKSTTWIKKVDESKLKMSNWPFSTYTILRKFFKYKTQK